MWERMKNEPAMVIATIVAAAQLWAGLSQEQVELLREFIEAGMSLVGGGVIRALVTPTRKLGGGS